MRFHFFIQDVFADRASVACLRYLMAHPYATGRELAQASHISQFKIRSVLQLLVKQGLLQVKSLGRAHVYSLNQRHFILSKIKPILAFEENFLSFFGKWVVNYLSSPKPVSLILFGSIARGEERPDSDVDLLLLYTDKDYAKAKKQDVAALLSQSLSVFGNRISPVIFAVTELKKKIKDKEVFALRIFKEGLIIAGATFSEVFGERA